jgi:hypothetical protein
MEEYIIYRTESHIYILYTGPSRVHNSAEQSPTKLLSIKRDAHGGKVNYNIAVELMAEMIIFLDLVEFGLSVCSLYREMLYCNKRTTHI